MTPQKVMPFSLDAVRQICTIEPLKSVEACSICSRIKPHVWRFVKGDIVEHVEHDDIPPETRKLRFFLDYGPNIGVGHIAQCPECLRLCECQHEYEYLIWGSETSTSFTRSTADRIVENQLWRYLDKPGELQFDGEAWQIVVDGRRNHRAF